MITSKEFSAKFLKHIVVLAFLTSCISCASEYINDHEIVIELEEAAEADDGGGHAGRTNIGDGEELPTAISDAMVTKDAALRELAAKIPEIRWALPQRSHYNQGHYKASNYANGLSVNQCNRDLFKLTLSLTQNWTLSLIDSFGKMPSGVLKADFFWPGDFDECQSFVSPKTKLFPNTLQGRYCLMGSGIPMASLTIGICVPRSCSSDELNGDFRAIRSLLGNLSTLEPYVAKLPKLTFNCLPESVPLSSPAIGCVVFLIIVFGLTIAGTLYDVYETYEKRKSARLMVIDVRPDDDAIAKADDNFVNGNSINVTDDQVTLVPDTSTRTNMVGEVLMCFSAIKNSQAILDTSARAGQLNCLHGIRFISMTWVILGHTYVFGIGQIANLLDVFNQLKTWPFQAIENATFSVDTFFLLSGFLVSYLFLKGPSNFTLKNLGYFYLHRYIRLTPVFMAVLFVYATLFNFIGDGPYWPYAVQSVNQCTKYWWRNLLYISNFFSSTDICMGWSWYLANDMQFYVISPVFLVFLKSHKSIRRWIGFSIILALLLTSWIYTGVLVKVKNLPIMFDFDNTDTAQATQEQGEIFDKVYEKPWTRIGPYLVGCLTAMALVYLGNSRRFLTRVSVTACWCGAIALALVDVYGLYNSKLGIAGTAFYTALSRSAWALAVAWVILACLTGNGGIVDKFLSWKFWFPLSRLTYCAYLTHPLVLYFYFLTLRAPIYLSNTVLSVHYIGFVVLSYALGFVTSIILEAPVIKLEKLIRLNFSKE